MMEQMVGVVFLGVGIAFLLVGIIQGRKAKAAEAWPTVPGVILSSELHEHRHHNSQTHHTSVTYEPVVTYQYSVMEQPYQGNKIVFGTISSAHNTASRKLAAYPQGAQVAVHYDPADPSKAVLEPKAGGNVMLMIIGVIFMVLGVVFIIL